MGRHGESSPVKRRRGDEDQRGHHGRGEGRGNGRGRMGSISGDRRVYGREGLVNQHRRALDVMACSADDDTSSITNNTNNYPGLSSTTNEAKSSQSAATTTLPPSTITILPWTNPQSHYIPIEEEERLLPVLLHWGKSERGMMKDQPPFRLQKLQKMLLDMQRRDNTPSDTNNKNNYIRHHNSLKQQQSSTTTTRSCCYCHMTLQQKQQLHSSS